MTSGPPRILALFGGAVLFGQERANLEALGALKSQGCQILCLVRDDDWNVAIPTALDAHGIAYRKVPYIEQRLPGRMLHFLFRNPVAFVRAQLHFGRVIAQFQPTHIYAFNGLYVANFLIGLILVRTPVVYRAGDAPTLHNAFFRWLWSFVVARTKHFVANSRYVERQLLSNGVSSDRVTVIYNRPPSRPEALPVSLPPDLGAPDKTRITYVGQLIASKGVHLLIDAFRDVASEYPNAVLLIAGRVSDWEGDAWARALVKQVVDDTLLANRVTFLGYVHNVSDLMRVTHIHVCPSLMEEPAANVVMEAKNAGVPSIVFPSGGLPELVEHGVTGLLCEEKTADALTKALHNYLRDPHWAHMHGLAARESLQHFNVPRFAERWERVIEEAVA